MYSIWSEPRIRLVLMIMLGMVVSTVIMLMVVLVMRRLQISEEKNRDLFIHTWRPLMTNSVENNLSTFPPYIKRIIGTFSSYGTTINGF